jgi:putative flippase GtrA
MEELARLRDSESADKTACGERPVLTPRLEPNTAVTGGLSNIPRWIPRWAGELAGYGLVSALALGVDTALLQSLVTYAGWNYLTASIFSFVTGALVAYFLSTWFVFRSRRVTNPVVEFSYFLALGVVGLGINTLVLWLTVGVAGERLVPSKLLAAVCTFGTNFVLRRWLLFSSAKMEKDQ